MTKNLVPYETKSTCSYRTGAQLFEGKMYPICKISVYPETFMPL
ncbi:hypothetical protein CHCC14600_4392 [Bacillus licheniformis]|nr:hypothetical protein B4090_2642 [Bacillus licheniformis]KYC81323.1 hypothetical protein B4091_3343 [Bacillus licheniformis]TWJ37749.1 hypothetical protein CHCC5026_2461 [Bacillus licheniformis]TWK19502.1 hypothetical protein CHCC20373_2766 [Bacillus licheniformis]TWK29010.1 hypothetical protein CHCC20369_0357 [Bacillus licheniformis]